MTEIGSGAFASVYRAIEVDTNRPVALKMLRPATLRPQVLETFTREMRALAVVSSHPHIVTLFRPFSSPDGHPVLVIELCQEQMAQRIRRLGPLPAQEVTSVGIKIAGALETAHRAGFLHRDMKPQNILITQFGEPALADFGVAALQASAQDTEGVFGFTTLHAPPELLEGQHLSRATDVYGLASTLYQLLAGRAPFATFQGEAPASVILRILRDPVEPLRSHAIPYLLSVALESALAKDPHQRPQTALEFAERLREVEASCGWPLTPYVVWDTPGRGDPATEAAPAGPPAARSPERPAPVYPAPPQPSSPAHAAGDPTLGSPALGGSAFGEGSTTSAGAVWPEPPIAPAQPPVPAAPVPAEAPDPANGSEPADGSEPISPQPAPPRPLPPLTASKPSVIAPSQTGRRVIDPTADPAYRQADPPLASSPPAGPRPAGPRPPVPAVEPRRAGVRPPVPPVEPGRAGVRPPVPVAGALAPDAAVARSEPPSAQTARPSFPPPPISVSFPPGPATLSRLHEPRPDLADTPRSSAPVDLQPAAGTPSAAGQSLHAHLVLEVMLASAAAVIVILLAIAFLTGRL